MAYLSIVHQAMSVFCSAMEKIQIGQTECKVSVMSDSSVLKNSVNLSTQIK